MQPMNRSMNEPERHVVTHAIASHEQELTQLRERGPWHDPVLEPLISGRSHAEKVAAVENRLEQLRGLQ
jgi:hypothetical protein